MFCIVRLFRVCLKTVHWAWSSFLTSVEPSSFLVILSNYFSTQARVLLLPIRRWRKLRQCKPHYSPGPSSPSPDPFQLFIGVFFFAETTLATTPARHPTQGQHPSSFTSSMVKLSYSFFYRQDKLWFFKSGSLAFCVRFLLSRKLWKNYCFIIFAVINRLEYFIFIA